MTKFKSKRLFIIIKSLIFNMKKRLSFFLIAVLLSPNIISLEHLFSENKKICTEQKVHFDQHEVDCSVCYLYSNTHPSIFIDNKTDLFSIPIKANIGFQNNYNSNFINVFNSRDPPKNLIVLHV